MAKAFRHLPKGAGNWFAVWPELGGVTCEPLRQTGVATRKTAHSTMAKYCQIATLIDDL